jgi:hypothetical protein
MHFLFSLLRIKNLYMFRALFAHPEEVLHKRQLVYCVRVMSVGCTRTGLELVSLDTSSVPLCVASPQDEQVMLETCRCPKGRFTHTVQFPCFSPAATLRGRFQNGIFVAWQGNGMVCVNPPLVLIN